MTSDRIKEIQKNTAYPNSVSVMIALNQVWNECTQENNQNTKPLIEKISSLEASLLDVTRKSCARVDELKDEIADLKSQLLISEQKVKLNYNCAIESSKSEANEGVDYDFIVSALNHYFNDAYINLERKDLGDIEKKNYEYQLKVSKEQMQLILNK